MNLQVLSSHPTLKKLIRECDKGDLLFSQGDAANSVFLVLEGCLELIRKHDKKNISLGTVSPGEFIGEKALLQEEPFIRKASAQAQSRCFLLELGPSQFSQLEKEAPSVYSLLLKKAFKTLISRNETLETFAESLKPYEPRQRFLSYIRSRSEPQKSHETEAFFFSPEQLAHLLNCSESDCRDWLSTIESLGGIKASDQPFFWYLVPEKLAQIEMDALEVAQAA